MTMYADDCVVYYANHNLLHVKNTLERNLDYKWLVHLKQA